MDGRDTNSAGRTRLRLIAKALTVIGALLVLAGARLGYPYIHSRLAAPPSPQRITAPPSPTVTPDVATSTPADSPTPSAISVSPTVTTAPTPTSTPLSEPEDETPAVPARIVIPGIGVDAPVVPISSYTVEVEGQATTAWRVPDMYAAGWHQTSAPLGKPGNTVFSGHNTTYGEVFRDLYTLKPGDAVIVYSGEISYTYTVSETLVLPEAGQPLEVRLSNARYILPTDDERLTLVTCHPYGSLRNRLIVIARPSD